MKACVVTVPAPSGGVTSGQAVLIGSSMFGVCAEDAAQTLPVDVVLEGVFSLPKPNSVVTFAVGAPVYWDISAGPT